MRISTLPLAYLFARHGRLPAVTAAGLFAIAISLAIGSQVFGQPVISVLFYGPNDSTESSFLPTNATFTVASETTWRAMTTSDFAKYDLIIIGDPRHGEGPATADLLAAYDTRTTWAAAISGRIVVSGMDPGYHASVDQPGAGTYLTATLDWLTKGPVGKSALYVASDFGRRNLDFLSPFGAFSSSAFEADTITITSPSHPIMIGSTSASLSAWNTSAHSFLTYPASFSSLATGTDFNFTTGSVVVARDAASLAIAVEPQNQTNVVGSVVTLSVEATGTPPFDYQWRRSSANLAGKTNTTLVFSNLQPSDAGSYTVVVTNVEGAITSVVAFVRVLVPPSITSQPTNQIVDVGSMVTFAVTATGTSLLGYQWRFNDANLVGKTATSLVLTNVQWTNAGNYSVVVTNAVGSVTSGIARLNFPVHRFDTITANPDHTISLNLTGVTQTIFAPYYDLYPLDASTNLVDWSPLGVLQRTNSSSNALSYLDRDGTNFEKRFYRTHTNVLITPFPKPTGPYPVGTVSRLMTDPAQHSFMVTFWYPAQPSAGVLPEAYVENNATVYAYLNERNPSIVAKFVSHAVPGPPLATNEARYPVLLYSTSGVTRRQNTDKVLELASHGYVVVAMEYETGVAFCATTRSCFQPTFDAQTKVFQFVADELSRLNTNDALFAGRLDLERLGAFGFSNGCTMAAEFCRIDARCKAVVLLDVGSILEAATDLIQLGLQKPFLSMNSAGPPRPSIPPDYNPEWLYATRVLFTNAISEAFWFQIQDSSHQSFQDRGSLISDPTRMADPTPASREQSRTIRACTVSFFDKYLKDEDDHLLDNPALVYTNIINFQRK